MTTVNTTADAVGLGALPAWNFPREALRATMLLAGREVRLAIRTPAYLVPNLIVPLFFYFITLGSLETFAAGFGLTNFEGFLLPMALLFAVQGGSAGLNMVADIESGYFDKLLLTPTSRAAVLIGAMSADFFRIMVQAVLVLIVALLTGLHFETGLLGAVTLIGIASLFGLVYSGIGFGMALKTGNAQATQSMWFLFMPLMFLTTLFAPKEALSGWLEVAATINPMTYILEGMRALAMEGWVWSDIGWCMLAIGVLGVLSLGFAFSALRGRLK
jgi:ABC-2 type transport system permease protein